MENQQSCLCSTSQIFGCNKMKKWLDLAISLGRDDQYLADQFARFERLAQLSPSALCAAISAEVAVLKAEEDQKWTKRMEIEWSRRCSAA
jgi:hypothetical protein